MNFLSIDRFDGTYVFCEDENRKMFAISISELPSEAKEGDIICIDDDGQITIDAQKTAEQRKKIKKLQDSIWE